MPDRIARPLAFIWNAPHILLVMTMLLWSSNMLVGKAMANYIPPVAMAQTRWSLACVLLLPLAWAHLRADWAVVRRHLPFLMLQGILGISCYTTLVYKGLETTTAVNAALLGAGFPVVIAAIGFLLYRDRLTLTQGAGILIGCVGALIVLTKGDLSVFSEFRFVPGDIWVVAAQLTYAAYTVLLRDRPAIHPLTFLWVTVFFGQIGLMPFSIGEAMAGNAIPWSFGTFGVIVYLAIFPALLAFMLFNRAVNLIGSNQAAPYFNLVAVFSVAGALLLLGERLTLVLVAGWVLIAAGIFLAQRRRASAPSPAAERPAR